jgi:hypothetical protein
MLQAIYIRQSFTGQTTIFILLTSKKYLAETNRLA